MEIWNGKHFSRGVKSNTFYEQTAISLPANAQHEIAYFKCFKSI